ncbi:MAG: type I-C CRISPR-associated protein Cas8c/Csd1 [Pyrinomonadaceae bacterium]
MLLASLSQFYKRSLDEGKIIDPAFTAKYIRWLIPITIEGTLEGGGLIEIPKEGGRLVTLPKTNRPKNAGGVAEFLWEGIEAMFSLPSDFDKVPSDEKKRLRQESTRAGKHEDFMRQLNEAFNATNCGELKAVIKFFDTLEDSMPPPFLRWGALNEGEKPCWLVLTAGGKEEKFKADNFTFQVNGTIAVDLQETRNFWREKFADEKAEKESDSKTGVCLVTGSTNAAISPSHLPKISSVRGASSMGAALISFDKDSFRSYGIKKSYNSPISFEAVEAYTNALNYLVSNKKHHFAVGETTLVFWARNSDAATDWISKLFDSPDESNLKAFLASPLLGEARAGTLPPDDFYSVTLGGNAGRIIVRDWMQITVAQALLNYDQWFKDLRIAELRSHHNDKIPPFSLYRLAVSTVRESKELRPEVSRQLFRAAVLASAPSISLIKGLVKRVAVDLSADGTKSLNNLSRFALLKLIINRNEKEKSRMIEEKLNPEIRDDAYNCGRLLAIFEDLQAAAHEYKLEGVSVVEKYYGTASSSPNSAFGILWRLHQHHLKKVSRNNRAKAEAIKARIAEICSLFEAQTASNAPSFPRSFDLRAQGRFALGFYQQIAADREARRNYKENKENSDKNKTGENE